MFRVKVNRHERTELHEQVAAEIRRAIADGEARAGERLPPAKDLAAVLGVNTNTVLRALRQLRDEGLLDFRRGRGVTVPAVRSTELSSYELKSLFGSHVSTAIASTSWSGSSKTSADVSFTQVRVTFPHTGPGAP